MMLQEAFSSNNWPPVAGALLCRNQRRLPGGEGHPLSSHPLSFAPFLLPCYTSPESFVTKEDCRLLVFPFGREIVPLSASGQAGLGLLAPSVSVNNGKADGITETGVLDVSLQEGTGVIPESQGAEKGKAGRSCWCV